MNESLSLPKLTALSLNAVSFLAIADNSSVLFEAAHATKNRALLKRANLSLQGMLFVSNAWRASSRDQEGTILALGGFCLNAARASMLKCLCSKSMPNPSPRGRARAALCVRIVRGASEALQLTRYDRTRALSITVQSAGNQFWNLFQADWYWLDEESARWPMRSLATSSS